MAESRRQQGFYVKTHLRRPRMDTPPFQPHISKSVRSSLARHTQHIMIPSRALLSRSVWKGECAPSLPAIPSLTLTIS